LESVLTAITPRASDRSGLFRDWIKIKKPDSAGA
jgi:hypothetical protein